MNKYFIFLGFTILFLLTRVYLDFPVTLDEAKEAYTSFSIIESGKDTNGEIPSLLFRGDNNYLSVIPIYLRVISVIFWGLGSFGVRIPGVVAGILGLFVFYKLSRLLFSKQVSLIAALVLSASPFFVQMNIFSLSQTLSILTLMAAFYFFVKKKTHAFLISILLSILSSFWVLPACLVIVIYYFYRQRGVKITLYYFVGICVFLGIIFINYPRLGTYLVGQSIVQDLKPSSYTFEIDKRLSFGKLISSPLITQKFNYNRLVFNKAYYGLTVFFKNLVKPFDYELLTSSFQAQTILSKERIDTVALPKIFFWEAPLIFFGIILALRKRSKEIYILFIASLTSLIVFGQKSFYILLPPLVWLNALSLSYILDNRTKVFSKAILIILIFLFLGSYLDFVYRLNTQKLLWGNPESVAQYKIWNYIDKEDLGKEKIIITDRLGDPAFYYLFYSRLSPQFFQQGKTISHAPIDGEDRILKIGDIEFRAFKYSESLKSKNELWIGLPGEFVGEKKDFSKITEVPRGKIITKISSIKQENVLLGDEIWIVRISE